MADGKEPLISLSSPCTDETEPLECMICREPIIKSSPDWQCRGCRKIFHYTCHQRYASNYPLNGCAHCHYGERPRSSSATTVTNQSETIQPHPSVIPPINHVFNPPNSYVQLICMWNCIFFLLMFTFPVFGYVYWIYSTFVTGGCIVIGGLALYYRGDQLFTSPQRSIQILFGTFTSSVILEFVFLIYKSIFFSILLAITNAVLILSAFYSYKVIRRMREESRSGQRIVETV